MSGPENPAGIGPHSRPRPRSGTLRLALAAAAVGAILLAGWTFDLSPRVEDDFFFASDDPQLAASREIEALFPAAPQVLVQLAPAGGDLLDPAYLELVEEVSGELTAIPGVDRVVSLTRGPSSPAAALEGPFWRRLLVAPEQDAALVLVELAPEPVPGAQGADSASPDPGAVVRGIEAALEERTGDPGAEVGFRTSGVPYVLEQIRRHLVRDLRVFSLTALGIFGLAVAGLFRSFRVVVGTLVSGVLAVVATLVALQGLDVPIGVLTANIATLVFVLTLSHIVFLTAAGREALARTRRASFWCAVTTLLGFASLLLASAQPLRELGLAGGIGTMAAFAAAYLAYPPFLPTAGARRASGGDPRPVVRPTSLVPLALLCLLLAVAAVGLPWLRTDASLLTYFAPGSELRRGLEAVDRRGGSSPLSLVVTDPDGGPLDTEVALGRLESLHQALEADPAVGTVLSPWALVAEARRQPLAAFLGVPQLVDLLSSESFGGVGSSVYTADRRRARFLLRMKEAGRTAPRGEVVARLEDAVAAAGFEPALTGGLYELQGKLATLVASSLAVGLGALVVLFGVLALGLSRRLRTAAAMTAGLVAILTAVLGSFGLLGRPLDIIASPAANLALALGVDSMIHLVLAARRLGWAEARRQMARPVLGSAAILAAGFGVFLLSSFPPTRSFGLAVVVGALTAAAVALGALPVLAAPGRSRESR